MAEMTSIHFAARTKTLPNSGTSPRIHLIVNQLGWDRLNLRMVNDDRMTGTFDQNESVVYYQGVPIGGIGTPDDRWVESGELYVRVLTSTENLWRPDLIFVWGKSPAGYLPLAFHGDYPYVLSLDGSEGLPSAPVHRVEPGSDDMIVQRLLLIVTTADGKNFGTNDNLRLMIERDGEFVVNALIGQTTQLDLEPGRANLYDLDVDIPFTKGELSEGSVTLRILGSDYWVPEEIWLFGIDSNSTVPNHAISLTNDYLPGPMSRDGTEGVDLHELTLT